jgi:hypothetical protein
MSHSRRKIPKRGVTTSESEKSDKRVANRRLRRAAASALHAGVEIMPSIREVSNVWEFAKDGKIRFNATTSPQMMRK